jgi:hypothetical protein
MEHCSSCTCRKTSVTEEPLPPTHNAERWSLYTCREKLEIGPSLENTSINVAIRGAVEAKTYVNFKMVYMERIIMKRTTWRNIMAKKIFNT